MGWQIHRWRPSHVDISHLMKLDTGKRFRHGVTDVEFGLDGSGLNLFCCCPIENRKIPNVNVASSFGGSLGCNHKSGISVVNIQMRGIGGSVTKLMQE